MTEPQLSVEMEKEYRLRFSAKIVDLCVKDDVPLKDINALLIDQMHFLATALVDERKKVIELLKESLGYHCDKPNCDHNLEEAIKVLNQLKEKHD